MALIQSPRQKRLQTEKVELGFGSNKILELERCDCHHLAISLIDREIDFKEMNLTFGAIPPYPNDV